MAEQKFDFFGYFLMPDKLQISGKTVMRFSKRIARVYEHGKDANRIGNNSKISSNGFEPAPCRDLSMLFDVTDKGTLCLRA